MNEFGGNPLVSDDRLRPASSAIEFGATPQALDINRPISPLGLQGMPDLVANIAPQLGAIANQPLLQPSAPTNSPQMFYSPSTGEMVVNGFQFNERNASQALASEEFARQPRRDFTLPDTATDWRELSAPEYQNYLDTIRNPGFGRRMGEAWEHAWRGVGDVALGASLAASPDWEWAQTARQNIAREYEENAPFMLRLRDVQNPGDAMTYASQMLVQGAPWIVETIASMGAGALIGGVVSGGIGAPAGAVEGFLAKEGLRRAAMTAMRQNLTRGAEAYAATLARNSGLATMERSAAQALVTRQAVRSGTATADEVNRFFNFGERAYHLSRGAGALGGETGTIMGSAGAIAGGAASNYATAVGDIRNSIADAGGDPTTAEALGQIWGMAIPYAAIESIGDLLITQPLTRVFPGIENGASHFGNALRGAGMGFATEAAQETAQYGIAQNAAAQATDTPISLEPIDLLETAIGGGLAGAGVGGLVGAFGATQRPNAGLLPPPSTAMGGPATTPGSSGPTGAPSFTPRANLGAMSETLSNIRAQESGGAYMGAVQDELAAMPPGQPRIDEEREMLRNVLSDPNATDEQRMSAMLALDALTGGQDVNVEAAQRAASQQSRGVLPNEGPFQGPIDERIPITQEELAGLQGPGRQETRADIDIPPGLPLMGVQGATRSPTEVFQDLAMGQEVPRAEMLQLRSAITQLQQDNPTNPGYAQVLSQLDSMLVEAPPLTDENSPEFRTRYPELSEYLAAKPPRVPYISPMDAARTRTATQLTPRGKAGARVVKLPPAIANPNNQFNDGLRGRTVEATPEPVQAKESGEDLLARTYQLAARNLLNELNDEELNRVAQITKVKRGKDAHRVLHEQLKEELEQRQQKKSGKPRSRLRKKLDKEGKGRFVSGDMIVTPESVQAKELPTPPKNKEVVGVKGTATVLKGAPIENARFVTQDETLEVSWAEGGKIDMPANMYYVYDGIPVRKDIYERTREPLGQAKFGADGQFRKKAGMQFSIVRATKDGNIKTLEAPKGGQNYKAGELIFTGVVGEQWNQSESKAAKSYNLKFEEQPNAIQERSATPVPVQKQPRTGEEDGSRDRTKYEAPRESPKPASNEKVPSPKVDEYQGEDVYGTEVDRRRVDRIYEAGKKAYPTLFSFLQGARGLLRRKSDRTLPVTTTKAWAKLDGKPVTGTEIQAVINRLQALDVNKTNPNGAQTKEAEQAVDTKAERKAARFADDLSDAFKRNKDDPKFFKEFVLAHKAETTAWLTTADAKARAGLRTQAERVLREAGPGLKPQAAYVAKYLRMPMQALAMRAGPLDNKGIAATKSGINNNLTYANQQIKLLNADRASKAGVAAAIKALDSAINMWPKVSADVETLKDLEHLRDEIKKDLPKLTVQRALIPEGPSDTNLTISHIKSVVDKVQKNINPKTRYRNTYVVKDLQDLIDQAETMLLTYPDGSTESLADLAAQEDPQGDYKTWIKQYLSGAAAVNIPYFNALIVNRGQLEGHTEQELIRVLEHEYIVHFGLRALFPNDAEHSAFIQRLGFLPGMEEKRQRLLFERPVYERTTNYVGQIEELIAFHAMEGPLALKQLLSAPEGIDQTTRRTLWEDFVILVNEWLNSVFGMKTETADMVLDLVVHALREHAIVGTQIDLNAKLDAIGMPTFDELHERHYGYKPLKPQAAVIGTAMPSTTSILYGTGTNPGRPYTPDPWHTNMGATIMGNLPLMEKLKEMGSKGATVPVREGLRKIGRNLETMNNMALRSTLVEKTMEIMHNTIAVARRLMTKRQETRKYAKDAAELAAWRKLWGDKSPGSTKAQRDAYNRMAVVATNSKLPLTSEAIVRAAPRILVRHSDGTYTINEAVFEALLAKGTFSKAEFEAGIEQFTVHGDGVATSQGIAKLPQEVIDAGYDIYVAETRHMAESHLEVLEHGLKMLTQMNNTTVQRLLRDNAVATADQPFLDEALQRMYKLYADIAFHENTTNTRKQRNKQKEKARQVLSELMRSLHEKEKVRDWTDATRTRADTSKSPRTNDAFKWREQTNPADDVKPFANQIRWFLDKDATGTTRLERLNGLGIGSKPQFAMLGAFQALLNTETQAYEQENDVIQSVLGNYVEFVRKGQWRVAVDIKPKNGKQSDIGADVMAALPVVYVQSQREAQELQAKLAEELSGTHTITNAAGDPIAVTFDVEYKRAPGTRTLGEAPKIKQFLEVADLVGLKLNATEMKKIANLIENAAGRKRFGLQRAGTPGMDADILKHNGETMTRRAWWAAKMSQAWNLNSVFDDQKNTFGDWDRLKKLQEAFDIANRGAPEGSPAPSGFTRNEAEVYLTETALLRYANQLRYMSPHKLSRPNVVVRTTKGEQQFKIEPEGDAHHDHAVALKDSLEREELELNLNDLLSKTGPLRMAAVTMQLGSVAAGIMNAFTLVTHLPWVLTARHDTTGYGEGFGMPEVTAEIIAAASQTMFNIKMQDSAYVKELLDAAKSGANKTNLTTEELEFLYQETLQGLLMPQQTYSMTGGTESSISSLLLRNFSEALLGPFGAMEAANRRVSALATYRLAKKRYLAAGVDPKALADSNSPEYKRLVQDVERVVFQSQGDYANVNRPKAFRGDLAQYVMMYKMFPLMTQLMLYNLPKAQQLSFLGVLFLLGGLKGEPFAEDIMDVYDTILQKLGFRHDSVELQLIQTLEDVLPGSSKWVMNGGIDTLAFGGTMSSRVSMGDILPMTRAFAEGADMGREIANAFGPAYAANVASLEWAWTLTDFAIQSAGLKTQTTSWQDLVRTMPQSQLRAIGEAALMATTGEITDPRGRLVSDEVTVASIFSRALGFYPLEATKANNAVRLDRMHIGYMRAVRARFILAYANAYRANDQERMDNIRQSVQDWNDNAEEAGQEDMMIRNFGSAARRAGRAASQTTIERTSSSAPNYSLIDELAGILNADTEADD